MGLTAKEEKFCNEYLKHLNGAKAALSAGYSKKTARHTAYENLTKPHIQARLDQLRKELQEKSGITAHDVIMELAALGFWSIKDFIQDDNVVKDLSKMAKPKLRPVVGIKVRETISTIGDVSTKEVTTELKLVDKRGALIDLGRHLGIFNDNKARTIEVAATNKDGEDIPQYKITLNL